MVVTMKLRQLIGMSLLGTMACSVPTRIDGYTVYESKDNGAEVYTIHRPDGYNCIINGRTIQLAQTNPEPSITQNEYALGSPIIPIIIARRQRERREHQAQVRAENLAAMPFEERYTMQEQCRTILSEYLAQKKE